MKQVELYNHNKITYDNIKRIFSTNNKCAVVQPTGSGKSFLIFKLAQDNPNKIIVIFEPNKQIISRISEQIKEYGIENIKIFTYQRLNSQYKKGGTLINCAGYICFDELHRIKAKQWEQAVIAVQNMFPEAKVLGLTATPERMDGENIIDYFGAKLACNITLGDAIVNKILPCPIYISALYTFDKEIQKVSEKIERSKNSNEEKNKMRLDLNQARKQLECVLGVPIILKKHIPNKNGKYIVFCQNVKHLNLMKPIIKDWFMQAGFEIHLYSVYAKNTNYKLEYERFKIDNSNCIKLCLCVNMFNEGVHLDNISGVILLRPTLSNIVYFQQIGRAISANDNNIPIIFDFVNNSEFLNGENLITVIKSAVEKQENILSNSNKDTNDSFNINNFHMYEYVRDSLDMLRNIENKIFNGFDYYIQQLNEYKKENGHCCVLAKDINRWSELYHWCNKIRTKCSDEHKTILNELGFVWDVSEWRWERMYQITKEYISIYKTHPTEKICYKGYNIGIWFNRNRQFYHNNTLSYEHKQKLNNIGMKENRTYYATWNHKLNLLREYVEQYGNISQDTVYKNVNLGRWLDTQKTRFSRNKLSVDRINALNSIDSSLLIIDKNKYWDAFICILKDYLREHSVINTRTIYKDVNIGSKLCDYKKRYKRGEFPKERYQQLLEIGIDLAQKGSIM